MIAKKLKDVRKGEWFTRKPIEDPKDNQIWIRGDYDRETKKYCSSNFDDINRFIYLKGETTVYVGYTF